MAEITANEYPNARIWVLTDGLRPAADERIGGESFFQPRGHIVLGLLKELSRTNGAATVIDGGEDTLGYCHANLASLQQAINTRPQREAAVLGPYRHWLAFAGTIAPWGESASKKDRKSTRLNSSHGYISYAVFCLKKKKTYLTIACVSG